MKVFLVLPAYNEAENLPRLLEQVGALSDPRCSVIVVDDGSADGTAAAAQAFMGRLELRVERHPQNLGLGPALRTGFLKALESAGPEDLIVAMDADNSHSPDLIPRMIGRIREGADVVIASRFQPGAKVSGLSRSRALASAAASFAFRTFFPISGVRDYTCGYRAVRAPLLKTVAERTQGKFTEATGFACSCELLFRFYDCGARFAEVPLDLRYDLKRGESKLRVWRTLYGYATLVLGRLARRRKGG